MTSRARPFGALSLALALVSLDVRSTHADPVITAVRLAPRLAPQDAAVGSGARPAPAATPMLADITGQPRAITLPELLQLAARNSPTLALARINVEIAEASVQEAQGWADWALQAQLEGSTSSGGGFFRRQDEAELSASIAKLVGTGGTIGVRAASGWARQEITAAGATTFVETYTEAVTATLSQPLLRGRGNAQLEGAERIAAKSRDALVLAKQVAAIVTVRDLAVAYLDLVDAQRQLEIRRASLELTRERLRVTAAGVDRGGYARAELIPVEQAIAAREEEILASEAVIADQSLGLRRRVGLPLGPGEMNLTAAFDPAIPQRTWDLAALVERARAQSPELARLAALEEGETIQIEVNEDGTLPSLDLALAAGPILAISPDDDSRDLGLVGNASLTYRQSLGATAAEARTRRARAAREIVRVTAADVRAQIAEAVSRTVVTVQTAERRYAIAVRAVALAEQSLQVEQSRFGLGKSRNFDVLTRQDELRAAQLRAAQAITDWHRAATVLASLTGELLPQYGITVP